MLRGQFIGSGGVAKVHLPRYISEKLGYSYTTANRLIEDDEVRIDGAVVNLKDVPVEQIAGFELSVRGETHEVPA